MGVGFYLIIDGNVEVRRKGKVLSELGSGQFFGEMALIDNRLRSADVVATAPTTCLALTAWSFIGLVRSEPNIAVGVMKELVKRLRGTNRTLTE